MLLEEELFQNLDQLTEARTRYRRYAIIVVAVAVAGTVELVHPEPLRKQQQ